MSKFQINPFDSVHEEPMKTTENGILVPRKAIVHTDSNHVLSIMGEGYQLIRNSELVESFERYLNDSDIRFRKLGMRTMNGGRQFYRRYSFPDIKVSFGEIETNHGKLSDDVEMMAELHNSYDGSLQHGFNFGGFRLVCLNGMRAYEKLYNWKSRHLKINEQEAVDALLISFDTVREMFQSEIVASWKAMKEADYDKSIAANFVKKLELSELYRRKLGKLWSEKKKLGALNTMWDFLNLITYFTTHYVDQRNYALSRRIATSINQNLAQVVAA